MPAEGGSLIHVAIKAETLFTIGPLAVTNSMIGALLASLVLLAAAWYVVRHTALVPGRMQSLIELHAAPAPRAVWPRHCTPPPAGRATRAAPRVCW